MTLSRKTPLPESRVSVRAPGVVGRPIPTDLTQFTGASPQQ